jgi:hypothetical protein
MFGHKPTRASGVSSLGGVLMKSLLTLIVLGMFSAAMVGCEASASVGDEDADRDTSYKKTTTVDGDGDRTVKTETKVERN